MATHLRRIASLLSVVVAPHVGKAQSATLVEGAPVRRSATGPRVAERPGDPPRVDGPRVDVRSARFVVAPVAVRGTPGSLEVVGVAVPEALAAAPVIRYRVSAEGRARVVGNTSGMLTAGPSRRGSIFFTVAAPTTAGAGRVHVATAEFDAPGATTIAVPVEMVVAPTHRVEVAVLDQMVGARAGGVMPIRVRAVNFGNQSDTVRLAVTPPHGWRVTSASGDATIAVPVRGARETVLRVWVPPSHPTGLALVRVVATLQGAPIASTDVQVQVGGERGGTTAGPGLNLSSISVAAPGVPIVTGFAATLDGTITETAHASGRATWMGAAASSGAAQASFARAGVSSAPPTLDLTTPSLRLGLGLTGRPLSDLAGLSVLGTGASVELSRGPWRTTLLGLRPYAYGFAADSEKRGLLVGGRVERKTGAAALSVTASRLDEPSARRSLDALSGGLAIHSATLGDLTSELGFRRAGDVAGMGWATELRRQTDRNSVSVRLLHAPGGSLAYARAADEINAAVSQRLTRVLGLSGSYWRTGDQALGASQMRSEGWSVGPGATLLGGRATVSLEARGLSYSAASPTGGFGNDERQGTFNLDLRRGAFYLSGAALVAQVARSTSLSGVALPDVTGTRIEERLAAGAAFGGASFEASATDQRFDGDVSAIPRQQAFTLRAEHIPLALPFGAAPILLGGDVQHVRAPLLASSSGGLTTMRVGATARLPLGFGLTLGAERNPYLLANAGSAGGWVTTLRFERLTLLPRLRNGSAGRVYRDADGDGRRDRSESGAAGVVVRCGSVTSVTDGQGRYNCASGSSAEIDPRSLPIGWLAQPLRAGRVTSGDLGLVSVAAVRVELVLDGMDSTRVRPAELAQVQVIARDSLGQPWMARSASPAFAVFDALPPGRYVVEVDASGIAEPLRLVTADPIIFIGENRSPAPLRLLLRGRATKVRVIEHGDPAKAPTGDSTATAPRRN